MKDINGKDLAPGQVIIVAGKDQARANVPILRKGTIIDLFDGGENYRESWIKIKYEETGRTSTIDGYMYMTEKRFCII